MSTSWKQTGICVVCVGLLISGVFGCSSLPFNLGDLGGFGRQSEEPAPKATPKPQASQPATPDVGKIIATGQGQLNAGKLNDAIASFEKALSIDPGNSDAKSLLNEAKQERAAQIDMHMKKGLQYNSEENLQAALKEWEAVLALDPNHAQALEYKERTQKQLDAFQ